MQQSLEQLTEIVVAELQNLVLKSSKILFQFASEVVII